MTRYFRISNHRAAPSGWFDTFDAALEHDRTPDSDNWTALQVADGVWVVFGEGQGSAFEFMRALIDRKPAHRMPIATLVYDMALPTT